MFGDIMQFLYIWWNFSIFVPTLAELFKMKIKLAKIFVFEGLYNRSINLVVLLCFYCNFIELNIYRNLKFKSKNGYIRVFLQYPWNQIVPFPTWKPTCNLNWISMVDTGKYFVAISEKGPHVLPFY